MKLSSLTRVLDDAHLQSLIVELITENTDILPLITVSKAWHVRAMPGLLRQRCADRILYSLSHSLRSSAASLSKVWTGL
jgi:hypothetical protein